MTHARSNLARARAPKPEEVLWEDVCFDAEQAAEKAIKALLLHKGIEFPKTHSIAELLALLGRGGVAIPDDIKKADDLTDYATAARYPGFPRGISETDFKEALKLAEGVVAWVERQVSAPPA
ncbi:MAG: HEPN domain-containing protein [Candidatus Coatesbacteria bacterium]